MQARIIDLTESLIYLEIDEQLRFKSRYVAGSHIDQLSVHDRVDFNFGNTEGQPCVVIRSVLGRNGRPPLQASSL